MVGDPSEPKSAPDPHHSSELPMPEGNARRWAVLTFLGFGTLMTLITVLLVFL